MSNETDSEAQVPARPPLSVGFEGILSWKSVFSDGFPPCDGVKIFVGTNDAGYCCCFNSHGLMSTKTGQRSLCFYDTAEGENEMMSGLVWWAELQTPLDLAVPSNAEVTGAPPHGA